MLKREFEKLYGREVNAYVFEEVNRRYMDCNLDKATFVAVFKASGEMTDCLEAAHKAHVAALEAEMAEIKERLRLAKTWGQNVRHMAGYLPYYEDGGSDDWKNHQLRYIRRMGRDIENV